MSRATSHHVLAYGADHDPRVPHFLKGSITPVRVRSYMDVTNESLRPFWNEEAFAYEFGDRLFYVSRETRIDLDFYPAADGFLASSALVEAVAKIAPDALRLTDVEMLHESGKPNSAKRMHFCRARRVDRVCDLSRMDIDGAHHVSIDGPNRIDRIDGHQVIGCAVSVALRDGLPAFFATREIPRLTTMVSDAIRDVCLGGDFVGPHFIPVEDIVVVDFMSNGGGHYSTTSPGWRARRDLDLWLPPVRRSEMFDPGSPEEARRMLEALLKKKH